MAKIILSFLIISSVAHADFLGFGSKTEGTGRINSLVEKLKSMNMTGDPAYEDTFNQVVKLIETAVEDEKLFCSGETADPKGKTVSKEQKQLCFRELKSHYMNAVSVIFDMKKKYLGLIHRRQLEQLTEIQNKMRSDIDKNF